ncbi:peroxisomal enoyl-CoA-hydratase [Marasmius fiardii PR-910]|nr:peroxisomal enoyl-CoA-hydratase [Marasmius fiardii PR-910]
MSFPDYSGYKEIKVRLDDGVLVVTIDRAKKYNTFASSVAKEIKNVFDLADRDDRVRVVIFTAEHTAPAYCSGADISGGWDGLFKEDEEDTELAHRDTGGQISISIYNCRKITIAAVNGHAAGVGITALQLPFDLRFVWAGAKQTLPFIRRGIAPEAGSTYLLPRLIGYSRANSLLLTGGTYFPNSHLLQSLYHEILPTREEVFPKALALAKELAVHASPKSVRYTKGLLQHGGSSIEETHLLDSRAIRILAASPDAAEGAKSFFERRPPRFEGKVSKDSWYPWWMSVDVKYRKSKL